MCHATGSRQRSSGPPPAIDPRHVLLVAVTAHRELHLGSHHELAVPLHRHPGHAVARSIHRDAMPEHLERLPGKRGHHRRPRRLLSHRAVIRGVPRVELLGVAFAAGIGTGHRRRPGHRRCPRRLRRHPHGQHRRSQHDDRRRAQQCTPSPARHHPDSVRTLSDWSYSRTSASPSSARSGIGTPGVSCRPWYCVPFWLWRSAIHSRPRWV